MVLALLGLFGPAAGLPTLEEFTRELLPAEERLSRRELHELVARYRERYWRENHRLVHRLRWPHPGAVWAMDFTEPPEPVEGSARAILVVRDLASGRTLEALPVNAADAATVCAVLQRLVHALGAPLVIKSDNGSHFTAAAVQDVLRRYGVVWLPSPPYCPAYNGSVEAGIGALKRRAGENAEAAGHAPWLREDVEQARLDGNRAPLRRLAGRTPDQAWLARAPIEPGLRVSFLATCRRGRERAALAHGELDLTSLSGREADQVQRLVVSRALVEYGFLLFRRRLIAPSVRRLKQAIRS
jgi:transposase InsO family protein